jgi:hypothetical protein
MERLALKPASSHYVLNDFFLRVNRVFAGVLQQPISKLLTSVGVAGKTLFFSVPQQTGRAGNAGVAFHFSSWLCQALKLIYDL